MIGVLVGCSAATPTPTPTATAAPTPTTTPSPTETTTPAAEDAAAELSLFTDVVWSVWGTDARYQGRAYVDALVAAGFEKAAMQVTPDETSIGIAADNIQFSVRWGDECLVGQVGPTITEPVTAVLDGLATGGCLLGQTRVIDW
ncbi:hypothetical protein GCM10009808_06180 [Microbacterium sediminicola]|uniref:DUF6993 domain-containing protein n=2 Tax=Microbacterium sediminicola TaxID=415210 RepID=A0ABN2HQU9_9MICO